MRTIRGWAFPDADEFMMRELKPDGTYQAANLEAALVFVTDWSIAIDGGAHVGTWAKLMAARFARVIAVEPCADTFEALTVNLAAFGCATVEPRRVALGAKAREVTMAWDGRGLAMRNTGARRVDRAKRATGDRVPCQPIDEWELPSLGLLKLDIEGSEMDALLGARHTLERCRPIVLFENKGLWMPYGYSRSAPQKFLASLGYRERATVSCDAIWGPA